MESGAGLFWLLGVVARELTLFAAFGFLIGGVDDLAVDAIWIVRSLWRRFAVYRRHPSADIDTLAAPAAPGRIAVFIPAWDEAAVIGAMLRHALAAYEHADYRLYVGAYRNDPATIAAITAVAAENARVRLAICAEDGPTTKAGCLNCLWHALLEDEIGIMYQMHQGRGRCHQMRWRSPARAVTRDRRCAVGANRHRCRDYSW